MTSPYGRWTSGGTSGYSGYSGLNGPGGPQGDSGISGYSGISGFSGYSGKSGYSGVAAPYTVYTIGASAANYWSNNTASYVSISPSQFKLDLLASWTSSANCYFEVTMTVSPASTGYCQIYSVTDSAAVTNSEVTTTSVNPTFGKVRSAAITLRTDKEYILQIKNSTTNTTYVSCARVFLSPT